MQHLLGSLTLVFAVAMVFIGLTSQIRKNSQERKCGLSIWMITLPLAVYLSRVGYAICIKSVYILIPDIFGVIFSAIILVQHFKYRKGTNTSPAE